jgi:ABC-type transport system involved in multi-copper enzyme maturation permease subunit
LKQTWDSLRGALLVARFDLGESLRSRKAIVLLILYVAGAVLGTLLFVELLRALEIVMADALAVARTRRPGAMTETMMSSTQLRDVLEGWTGDPELAASLVTTPPIALFYGWLSMAFVPVLVVLTSAEAISGELATGSVRFSLTRVDRSAWAAGKALGQAALLAVGIGLGSIGAFIVGAIRLGSFEALPTALALLSYSGSALVYGLAWLSLVLGASQLTASVPGSRALAFALITSVGVASPLLEELGSELGPTWLFESLRQSLPSAHRIDLFRPDLFDRLPAVIALLAFGAMVFALCHQRFLRRDV